MNVRCLKIFQNGKAGATTTVSIELGTILTDWKGMIMGRIALQAKVPNIRFNAGQPTSLHLIL